jgi:CBS domain
MTPAVKTVTRQVTLRDLEALFEKHDFNAFPVVEAGKMLGITTSQIVPHFDELMRRTVADVMTEAVVHVEPAAPVCTENLDSDVMVMKSAKDWCDGFVPNAHGSQSACDDGAIDAIPIADKVKRSRTPRERFG